jgi:hypothetical protein
MQAYMQPIIAPKVWTEAVLKCKPQAHATHCSARQASFAVPQH